MRGFITAIRTLTIIPVPGREGEKFSSSLIWFSPVGLLLGFLLFSAGSLWSFALKGAWTNGGAVLVLFAGVFLTRGLHLDGLADWADAMGGPQNRETRLAIMKDSHLGTFGVIALIIVLLSKWVAFERLLSAGALIGVMPVMVVSRSMMAELIASLPYARSGGGTAQPFVEGVMPWQRAGSLMISLGLCLCFGPPGGVLFFIGWIGTRLLAMTFKGMFGGITGDLLGATNETIETLLLVIWALPGPFSLCYTGWGWILS